MNLVDPISKKSNLVRSGMELNQTVKHLNSLKRRKSRLMRDWIPYKNNLMSVEEILGKGFIQALEKDLGFDFKDKLADEDDYMFSVNYRLRESFGDDLVSSMKEGCSDERDFHYKIHRHFFSEHSKYASQVSLVSEQISSFERKYASLLKSIKSLRRV